MISSPIPHPALKQAQGRTENKTVPTRKEIQHEHRVLEVRLVFTGSHQEHPLRTPSLP